MSHDNKSVFYKPFFLVVLASIAFMALIGILITSNNSAEQAADTASTVDEAEVQAIEEVTAPVAEVAVAGSAEEAATPAVAAASDKPLGQSTYESVCAMCHAAGLAEAPIFEDATAWAPRIEKGLDTLYTNAINGINLMPAKGGADISDDAVKAAVNFMVNAAGGDAPTEEAAAPAEAAESAAPAAEETAAAPAAGDKGKEVYDGVCFACHGMGIAGAPKFGDPAVWEERIAKGTDVLYDNAINGFMGVGLMPPKGGRADLSDDDVKAAVDYMIANSQ